jgi:hypothetical protein
VRPYAPVWSAVPVPGRRSEGHRWPNTDVCSSLAAGADCETAGGYTPTLAPGEEFTVCVTVTVRIPFLPEFIDANTATGQFVVERDRYVDG